MVEQAGRLTLTSRAFHNDQLALFYEEIAALTGSHKVLPMNSGAEAVESAIKSVRKWGYEVKGSSSYTRPFTVNLTQNIELDTELVDEFCLENEKSYERMQRSRGK